MDEEMKVTEFINKFINIEGLFLSGGVALALVLTAMGINYWLYFAVNSSISPSAKAWMYSLTPLMPIFIAHLGMKYWIAGDKNKLNSSKEKQND